MSRFLEVACCIASAASICAASGATASVKVATYTGTIVDGLDRSGIFGAPGASLTGDTYRTTYTYVSGAAGHSYIKTGEYDDEFGGGYDGSASPVVSASLTINGVTVSIAPDYYGEVETDRISVSLSAFETLKTRKAARD